MMLRYIELQSTHNVDIKRLAFLLPMRMWTQKPYVLTGALCGLSAPWQKYGQYLKLEHGLRTDFF
jgi:hypothetical protein